MSIQRFKECKACGKTVPRTWSESKHYECAKCKERNIRRTIDPNAIQSQAQKAAQHRDPRAAQMARAMAQDQRSAARGTQQDPSMDPMHILNPLNPLSPVSPLNPLNDWDASSHRNHEASSVARACDDAPAYHHTSHDSGSSYDSGSDSSSYTSGGCD